MQVVHPQYLWGVLAAVTPVVIYILLRRRKTEVLWGASYLLRLTLASKKRTSLWRQMLVLVVRCLILAIMALLLAEALRRNPRPSARTPQSPPGPVHRAIVVDNSVSMSCREGSETRGERMRSAVASLLQAQRSYDMATLIRLVRGPEQVDGNAERRTGRLTRAEARAAAESIRLREGTVSLSEALRAALSHLATTPRAAQELYVFSDFPRELDGQLADLDWVAELAASRRVRVVAVNVAGDASEVANVAVRGISLGTDTAVAGVPTTLHIDLENCSDAEAHSRLVVARDGRADGEKTVILRPNEHKRATHTVTFERPGLAVLTVGVAGGRLDVDTRCHLSVDVRSRPLVWLLAETDTGFTSGTIGEGEFLSRALESGGETESAIQVEAVELRRFTSPIPEDVDVVCIAGHPLNASLGEHLSRFVRGGGGLVLAPSAAVVPDGWRKSLGEYLPVVLDAPWRETVDPEVYVTVDPAPEQKAHPLFEELGTLRNGALGNVRVYNYLKVRSAGEEEPAAVLRLSNGDPYLICAQYGRGTVCLLTSSLGISWSSLAVQRTHLPLLYRLIGAAMAGRGFPRNLDEGERFAAPWAAGETATLVSPNGEERSLAALAGFEHAFIVVEQPGGRGLYRIRSAEGREESFTVRGGFPEHDLRPIRDEQARHLRAALGAPLHPGWTEAVQAMGPADRLLAWWPWLLVVLVTLYLFETWFLRKL